MARRDEAAELCLDGHSPSDIASSMGITPSSVVQYLHERVGAGALERTDLLLAAIPAQARTVVESTLAESSGMSTFDEVADRVLGAGVGVNQFDLRFYMTHRTRPYYLGDQYRYIAEIELALHRFVQTELREEFGDDWWRQGIPRGIRMDCAARREEDDEEPRDPWAYANFIHLQTVFEKQWRVLSQQLPKALRSNRSDFLKRLGRANRVRNRIMHPVRFSTLAEDELSFIRSLHADLQFSRGDRENDLGPLGRALMEALREAARE